MDDMEYLQDFASRHHLVLVTEGEVGFGRECVGLADSENYVAHNPHNLSTHKRIPELECGAARRTSPPQAYHKHDCLAVLGRGERAIRQLARWVRALEEIGEVAIVSYQTGAEGVQALISGRVGRAVVVHEQSGETQDRGELT